MLLLLLLLLLLILATLLLLLILLWFFFFFFFLILVLVILILLFLVLLLLVVVLVVLLVLLFVVVLVLLLLLVVFWWVQCGIPGNSCDVRRRCCIGLSCDNTFNGRQCTFNSGKVGIWTSQHPLLIAFRDQHVCLHSLSLHFAKRWLPRFRKRKQIRPPPTHTQEVIQLMWALFLNIWTR